jgi:hypothetical protein
MTSSMAGSTSADCVETSRFSKEHGVFATHRRCHQITNQARFFILPILPRDEAKSSRFYSIARGKWTFCCKRGRRRVQHRAFGIQFRRAHCNSLSACCTRMALGRGQCGNCYFTGRQRHRYGYVDSEPKQRCRLAFDKEPHFSGRCLSSLPERRAPLERRLGCERDPDRHGLA